MASLSFALRKFGAASISAILLSCIVITASAEPTAVPLLPIEQFFDNQSISNVSVSPDGSKVAMIAPNSGRYSVAVLDTKTGKLSVPVHFTDENIRSVFWKGNDRLLFTSAIEGHEIPLLAAVDLMGKSYKRILEPRRTKDDQSIFFGNLVDRLVSDEDHILITGFTGESDARRINPSIPRNPTPMVYKVDVNTARRAQVVGLDRGYSAGWFDREGNQRMTTVTEGKELSFRIRENNNSAWRVIKTFDVTDVRWEVRGILTDGRTVYIVDYTTADRGELKKLNLDSGEIGPVVFSPPEGVITGLIYSPKRDRLLGVAYEGIKNHTHWLDDRWKTLQATLQAQFKEQSIAITSISDDEKRFTFLTYSDRDPGKYFLADLSGDGLQVQMITAARPAIKPELMSPMQPVQLTARDGLNIQGYLTKPLNQSSKPSPLLIVPHGGPFGIRDRWGYNPEVQFLANRGYAVLQVNYRGSGGYGRSFEYAGHLEWGGKMQDDLTDAVKAMIDQGLADTDNIGIMGASYGGYAALAGVTFTPDLYKVAINYVGVSDLRLITRYDLRVNAASKANYEMAIGKDPALLSARSPVDHVENIRVPTLHAYGRNDPRVDIGHWEVLEKALKKYGKNYEILIEDKEGHGFEKVDTAYRYYRTVEAFLAKHLPANPTKN